MGAVLLASGLLAGAAPANAAGWNIMGNISYATAGSGTVTFTAELHHSVTYSDPRCVPVSTDFHPNAVMTTTIGSSTYTSPPLSQWAANTTTHYPMALGCHDASGTLITDAMGTQTDTLGTWTLNYSCQLAGLAITGTLTDPDAGLTNATGYVLYNVIRYSSAAGSVPDYNGALPASCPAYPAPAITLSTPPAPYGAPAGGTVTLTGTGYVPGAPATVVFETDWGTPVPVGSATVGPDGSFSADIIVPAGSSPVQHRVTVSSTGSLTRSVSLYVTPGLSTSVSSGGFGSTVTLTGWNYPAGQALSVGLSAPYRSGGTISTTLGEATARADGTFTYTTTIPWSFPAGPSWLVVGGAEVPFTVLSRDQAMDAKAAAWGLGTATSPTTPIVSYGYYRNYQYGAIISAPSQALFVSRGAIRGEWAALAFENGVMGYPTTDEVGGLVNGGLYQNYVGGAILWSPATGAHESLGVIRGEWQSTGFESGVLGYPTTEVITGLRNGGSYQNYQGGAIVSSPASGTHESIGAIRGEWQATGFENGGLGYPTTEVVTGLLNGGSYQNYQGGAIVSSPASGTHVSVGAIRGEWQATGFEGGVLGYPTTEEVGGLRDGGVYQTYGGGAIIWSPATGAHETYGPIRAAWQSTGFESGRLGYPTSDVYTVPNGTAQDYQGGRITDITGTIIIS